MDGAMSGIPRVYPGLYDARRFGGRARLSPHEPHLLKDGDVVQHFDVFSRSLHMRFWPDAMIYTTRFDKELRVPLAYRGTITDLTQWITPIMDGINDEIRRAVNEHRVLIPPVTAFPLIIFELLPTSPLISKYLGFVAPAHWRKIVIKYSHYRPYQPINSVYVHFSNHRFHGVAVPKRLVAALRNSTDTSIAGQKILEYLSDSFAKMSDSNQMIGVIFDNIDRYIMPFCLMVPGWCKVDYQRNLPPPATNHSYLILRGPSRSVQQQVNWIQRDAEDLGFAYKMQISPPGMALVANGAVPAYNVPSSGIYEFRALKSSRYSLVQVVIHQTLVDLTLVLADQFGLVPDLIFFITDWLPDMANWSQFMRMQSIWGAYKTVQRIRAERGTASVAASSSASATIKRSLADLRATDVAPPGATVIYGRSLRSEPFVIPQNRELYDTVKARIAKYGHKVIHSRWQQAKRSLSGRKQTAVRSKRARRTLDVFSDDEDEDSSSSSSQSTDDEDDEDTSSSSSSSSSSTSSSSETDEDDMT